MKELDTPKLKAVLKKCVQFSDLLNSFKDAYFNVVLGNLFQKLGAASPFFFNLHSAQLKVSSFLLGVFLFVPLPQSEYLGQATVVCYLHGQNGRSTVWEIVSKIQDKFRPGIAVAT